MRHFTSVFLRNIRKARGAMNVETWISFSEENKKVDKQVYYYIYRAQMLYRICQ